MKKIDRLLIIIILVLSIILTVFASRLVTTRREIDLQEKGKLVKSKPPITLALYTVPLVRPVMKPKVAIIIDDLGYNKNIASGLLDIDLPLTVSVLPGLCYSEYLAEEFHKNGFEIMLHLPMEPKSAAVDPGDDAIFVNMSNKKIKDLVHKNLESVPYAVGVNNHMGSKATEDLRTAGIVLSEVKKKGLFFVDSYTARGTVAADLARKLEMPHGVRNVFIDNEDDPEYITSELIKLVRIAKKEGYAIGIGHVKDSTIKVLKEQMPRISKEEGIEFVYASKIVNIGRGD